MRRLPLRYRTLKDALAYLNRGLTWSDKKEYDKAIADYSEAISESNLSMPGLPQPRQRVVPKRRNTTRRSPTSMKRSGSARGLRLGLLQPRQRLVRQE